MIDTNEADFPIGIYLCCVLQNLYQVVRIYIYILCLVIEYVPRHLFSNIVVYRSSVYNTLFVNIWTVARLKFVQATIKENIKVPHH